MVIAFRLHDVRRGGNSDEGLIEKKEGSWVIGGSRI